MARTASDTTEQIAELATQLRTQAETEVRRDIAAEFAARAKARDTDWFASVAGKDVELTADYLAAIATVVKALRDTDFDY